MEAIEPSVPSISTVHGFVSPGVMRFVSTRSGNAWPLVLDLTQQYGVVHVLYGTVPPAAVGRSETMSERIARTFSWLPARPQREMERADPDGRLYSVLAVESGDALPVDRLRRVEVVHVEKQRPHLDRAPETALADERATSWRCRE